MVRSSLEFSFLTRHKLKSPYSATFTASSVTAGIFKNPSQLKVEDKIMVSKVYGLQCGWQWLKEESGVSQHWLKAESGVSLLSISLS